MNLDRMAALVEQYETLGEQPCSQTRDGTHNWQYSHQGHNDARVFECVCGAVEVRKPMR